MVVSLVVGVAAGNFRAMSGLVCVLCLAELWETPNLQSGSSLSSRNSSYALPDGSVDVYSFALDLAFKSPAIKLASLPK